MNIQTEILDGHVARLTVEVDEADFEKAKKKATKLIAKKVNIPGFRKGHAPSHVIISYYGEAAIVEEAVEILANEMYPAAIESSELNPYASGTLENFTLEPQPQFIFSVPLQPEYDLKDYRSIRVDYDAPVFTDEELQMAMLELHRQHVEATPSTEPSVLGDRVSGSLHGYWADEVTEDTEDDAVEEMPEADAVAEEATEFAVDEQTVEDTPEETVDLEDDEDDDLNDHSDAIIHEHDIEAYLYEEHEFAPGITPHLVGVLPGERREFTLTYPQETKYGAFAGRVVRFVMDVTKVEHVVFPELNDDLAREITKSEATPLNLEELRERIRENMLLKREEDANQEYVRKVMDEIAQQAVFRYPEQMIVEEVDNVVKNMASRIGMEAPDFLKIMQQYGEEIYKNGFYRFQAINRIQQLLILRGVMEAEHVEVTPAQVDAEIEKAITLMDGDKKSYRKMFATRSMRDNVYNTLLEQAIMDRIVQIGRGLAEEVAVVELTEQSTEATVSDSE